MSSDEKSLKSAIEEAVALEEAGNLEESLSKWKEIRAVKDTPNAALRHGCLARELKKWDEAELAGLAGMQLDRAASFDSRQGRYESLVRQEGGLREEPPVFMRVSINLAEREGFEPPIPVKVCPLSRRIVSTTHAPLRVKSGQWPVTSTSC